LFFACDDIGKDYQWQGNIPPGFSRTFGTVGYDYGWNASYSQFDDGIIVVGQRAPEIGGKSDLWAIKTNTRGVMEWEQYFGGGDNEAGLDVVSTSDGGFLFVGYTWSYSNSQQMFVIKTDFHGNKEWEKVYGGSMWEVAYSAIEVIGGGYIIAGSSNSPGISSGNTDIYLVKIDQNGEKIWEKAYGNKAFPNHEWAYDIIQLDDQGFILVGARDRYSKGSLNGLILRIDEKGDLLWEKELLDESQISQSIFTISKSAEGFYYLCSGVNSVNSPEVFQPTIIKIDGSGNIDWQRRLNSNSHQRNQFSATTTNLGGVVVVGSSRQPNNKSKNDAFMTKLDNSGNIIWSNSYGSMDEDDWGWSLFESSNNNLVFVGSTKSFGASLFDILLVGTNPDGISK
tara:strand:- start:3211 stop:4401 length:1191 start_codon:yes stop_codon:yes gene_type:complete